MAENNNMEMKKFEMLMQRMLNEQEERITNNFREMLKEEIAKFNERIEKIEHNIIGNKNSIKNLEKEINDIKEGLKFTEDVFDDKISDLHARIDATNKEKDELEEQLSVQEDRNRRCNLRIDGMKEYEGETEIELEEKVKKLFKEKLEIEKDIEIQRIHRTGQRYQGKPRTVIFNLLRYKDKVDILKQGRKLKGSKIWINEDFSKRTLNIRKKKLAEIKRRKENGEHGLFLKYKTIKQFKIRTQFVNDENTQVINDDSTERIE